MRSSPLSTLEELAPRQRPGARRSGPPLHPQPAWFRRPPRPVRWKAGRRLCPSRSQEPGAAGARSSRGRPGGAAPPQPARPAPTPPPPSRRSGQTESAGAPGAAGADMDPNPRAALERQQLRLRERQKFFEDILQPETEFVFPLSHLHLESHRPPIGSISSMEVNVDTLEQVELIDLGDQDGADVFLPCEDPPPTPQTSGVDDHPEELSLPMPTPDRTTSRTSSSSSDSSINPHSPNPSDGGADTPLAQSDEEDGGDGGAEPGACS
ncbi:dysbindin domain-containing protein 2 isoform X4 [Vicugna pacos]|uniref:Dysbindin domain-containing protein 2 isoform X4 n=2 Tax=Vicugna pacos TaxID=30538 RepID=A0A6J3BEH2_VICPA